MAIHLNKAGCCCDYSKLVHPDRLRPLVPQHDYQLPNMSVIRLSDATTFLISPISGQITNLTYKQYG